MHFDFSVYTSDICDCLHLHITRILHHDEGEYIRLIGESTDSLDGCRVDLDYK